MIVPDAIYNVETSRLTQIISNAIIDFYTDGEHKYNLPLRIPESIIVMKKENLQFLYYIMYAAIVAGKHDKDIFDNYYKIYEQHQLFSDKLLACTDFNGDTLAFAFYRVYEANIPLLLRSAYMAEYVNKYTHETWPPYSRHHLKYLDVNHLKPKIIELKNTMCEICMGDENTEFVKTVCGHHIHLDCYKLLSKE